MPGTSEAGDLNRKREERLQLDRAQRQDILVNQQVADIEQAFRQLPDDKGFEILTERAEDGGVLFMCHPTQMLVRVKYLEQVQAMLGQPVGFERPSVKAVIAGVVLLTLDIQALKTHVPLDDHQPLVAALRRVDQVVGEGVATPNHVLTVCPGIVAPCPATEPRIVDDGIEPYPGIRTDDSGSGVLIYVADTGLLKGADKDHFWLKGVKPGDDGYDPDVRTGGFIPPYAGHGTFVAGVARCMAPQADVIVSNVFKVAGSALESDFVADLKEALGLGVDIFHLSVATPSRNNLPLLAFEGWLALLGQYKGVVCVVAAGNSGVRLPMWPAAFRQVVSVGALTADGRDRASFSDYGGWVDVYAPGRDIINAYATGVYKYRDAPYTGQVAEFYGMARWSGTSFSTPIVTGLIAARMSRTGENGQEAAAALLREARSRAIPGVGAILLPWRSE
jgi:hypothetical protein